MPATESSTIQSTNRELTISHFQRKPFATQFSLERYFEQVRLAMGGTTVRKCEMPFRSKGVWRRLANMVFAVFHQADINHVTGDITYVTLLLRKRKTLLTFLDCEILERLTGWKRSLIKFAWFTVPASRASAISVISMETKRQLLKQIRFPAEDIHVIPVCIPRNFKPSPKTFNSERPRILQIGTKKNKNVHRLVQALSGVACELVIVGQIDRELAAEIQRCNVHVENLNSLSDSEIRDQYHLSDLVSFVSTCEGFGMPIVEAQVVERPVVTSNCSSMPEVAGDGACLVDPFDVAAIRAGVTRVISDCEYRENLIDNGRENCKRFDSISIADMFAKLYQEIESSE